MFFGQNVLIFGHLCRCVTCRDLRTLCWGSTLPRGRRSRLPLNPDDAVDARSSAGVTDEREVRKDGHILAVVGVARDDTKGCWPSRRIEREPGSSRQHGEVDVDTVTALGDGDESFNRACDGKLFVEVDGL